MTWVIAGWSFLMLAATWAWYCVGWACRDRLKMYRASQTMAGIDRIVAKTVCRRVQPALGDAAGTLHCVQVATAIVGLSHVREQQFQDLVQPHAAARNAQRRNPDPFLIDVLGAPRKAAGDHAADILPVRHDTDDGKRTLAAKYRVVECDVVQESR